jgi:hypothetical protein
MPDCEEYLIALAERTLVDHPPVWMVAAVGVKAGPDDQAFDLLGTIRPDFTQIRPNLGTPQDSDPANPYPPSPLNLAILALPLPKLSPLLLNTTSVITVGATLTLKTG